MTAVLKLVGLIGLFVFLPLIILGALWFFVGRAFKLGERSMAIIFRDIEFP